MTSEPQVSLFNIGVTKETVAEARAAIVDILETEGIDQSTRVEALKTLATICNVSNTSIQGCQFYGAPSK